ncbi:MAG: 2-amino-4-deoxychorismate dehydrogenase [Deltaproteobacteria bacterium ADurb.Bin510]|nr:MAG: 2-amino-4-deoxychorismate dehydrogenase [Deltaproteobacteria bacterium ADurb.Bin510]
MAKKVVAIVGSYRKGGVIDTAIDEVLAGAKAQGAETEKIYLIDEKLLFCTNCRACTQAPGTGRGKCVLDDGLEAILTKLDQADALVLGSPVNYYNITAISRQFLERLVGSAYWPWGKAVAPKPRSKALTKPAVLITSAAMPGFLHAIMTGAPKGLKLMAGCLGAKPVKTLSFGMLNMKPDTNLSKRQAAKARAAAQDLLNAQI